MIGCTSIEVSENSRLPSYWEGACYAWLDTIQEICRNFGYRDAPWEYMERTNSAIFASALSANSAPAMPETLVMRDGRIEQKSQCVDICVVADNGIATSLELIEFKLAEYNAIGLASTRKRIQECINNAAIQVTNITGIHGKEIVSSMSINRTAAVIGLPYFEEESSSLRIDAIQKLIQDIKDTRYSIKAWCFPEQYVSLPSIRYYGYNNCKRFYSGTFLIADQAEQIACAQQFNQLEQE